MERVMRIRFASALVAVTLVCMAGAPSAPPTEPDDRADAGQAVRIMSMPA
jgi:hypothetical protein